jgi:hypothetical protein
MKKQFDRQSFLGADSEALLESSEVGIIGLGGGGSHIAQQLAYVGVGRFTLIDPQQIEASNLNRMVGATSKDICDKTLKIDIADRMIRSVNPNAKIEKYAEKWQPRAHLLRKCSVLFGCVDSFSEREQLEILARRYLIPYIDIGMDVYEIDSQFSISGQVILSMPGNLCLRCFGFLNDRVLKEEARKYGAAGGKPQVIWPNGMLASTAVGLFIHLITPWQTSQCFPYLEYDGNKHSLVPSLRFELIKNQNCPHFDSIDNIGDPFWKRE